MKFCKDCNHNDRDGRQHRRGCLSHSKIKVDLVDGHKTVEDIQYCFAERADAALCGPDAKYYVRIPWKFWRPVASHQLGPSIVPLIRTHLFRLFSSLTL